MMLSSSYSTYHQGVWAASQPILQQAQQGAMSYSYGPTVVYPAFPMGDAFVGSTGFDAKENSTWTHVAAKEAFVVFEESSYVQDKHSTGQAVSTSSRMPLAEVNTNSTSTSQAAAKRSSGAAAAARKPSKAQQWKDIDAENRDNPLACSEYAQAIFEHLHSSENTNRPNPGYVFHVQHDMTSHMRRILVDWLVEVAQEYRLTSDTLHLTIDLLNRFLSLEVVAREELQLAGISCMWIASKYEEIYAPSARNFCYITDNTYEQAQLVDMEARVLSVLGFAIASPTAKTFQRRYLQAAAADEQLHYLAAFLLELSLMDEALLAYPPSQVAAGSVLLARAMLGRRPWDATLAHYSRYEEGAARQAAADLAYAHYALLQVEGSFMAILDKYSSDRLLGVSRLPPCLALAQASPRFAQEQQEQAAQLAAQEQQQGPASSSSGGGGGRQQDGLAAVSSEANSDMELV